jgi:hypothetical protein
VLPTGSFKVFPGCSIERIPYALSKFQYNRIRMQTLVDDISVGTELAHSGGDSDAKLKYMHM